MMPLKEAIERVVESVSCTAAERLGLLSALGRVLSEDIVSLYDLPAFDNSAMDGYAVRSQDVAGACKEKGAKLKLCGEVSAGHHPQASVGPGEAARIMTGAQMPDGADAVVMQEDCQQDGEHHALVFRPVRKGENVRYRGEDVRSGSVVARVGDVLTPPLIALLASIRRSAVLARQRPRVAILSTGDEICELDAAASSHAIVDSNSYLFAAYVSGACCEPLVMGIAPDREDELRGRLNACLACDAIITTGGASVGKFDYVRKILVEMGIETMVEKVAIKPGRPFFFGVLREKPVFVLPGNPAGAAVCFEIFVRPALLRMCGRQDIFRHTVMAAMRGQVKKKPGRAHIMRCVVQRAGPSFSVELAGEQGSAIQTSLARANSLAVLPAASELVMEGEMVRTILLDGALQTAEQTFATETKKHVPVISVVGRSNSGKTTLIEKLIPVLRSRGYRVATIKHDVHGFEIDREGKDTWRHRKAGAHTVVIASSSKMALMRDIDKELSVEEICELFIRDVDLVITEGYKRQSLSKIEVLRAAISSEPLCTEADRLLAIASDVPVNLQVPAVPFDDAETLADIIEQRVIRAANG